MRSTEVKRSRKMGQSQKLTFAQTFSKKVMKSFHLTFKMLKNVRKEAIKCFNRHFMSSEAQERIKI